MKKIYFVLLACALAIGACLTAANVLAYAPLFPESYISSRTINWSYDGSCTTNPLPELQRATRIWDRLLYSVTINYAGIDITGWNTGDSLNTVSCRDYTWFSNHGQASAGAFVDHSGGYGNHLFDMVFRDDIVTTDSKAGAALHEWTHVLGLNHPSITAANHWSAVYGDPFGFISPSAANPYQSGWTEYPSNDDIVGLSTLYGHAANCTPYLSSSNKLYLPFIPGASGSVNSSVYASGYWAVLQWDGASTVTMLEYGTAAYYPYDCSLNFTSGVVTATGYMEAIQGVVNFHLTNNDTSGATVSSWTVTSP